MTIQQRISQVQRNVDDHAEFNAEFEAMRVATGPHLPISLADVFGRNVASTLYWADGSIALEGLELRPVSADEYNA